MIPVLYSPAYTLSAHGFDTTRKAKWVADAINAHASLGCFIRAPHPADYDTIAKTHDAQYISALMRGEPRELAESNELKWDSGLWDMVCASNGGMIQAATMAAYGYGNVGTLSSGLHHARWDKGAGYCTLNGLALAAREITKRHDEVLIIDLDAHCGGGTHSLIGHDPYVWHMDVSTDPEDAYTPDPIKVQHAKHTLDIITDASDYLPTIQARLNTLSSIMHPHAMHPRFKVCIYNAGMDPHGGCAVGGLKGITKDILRAREDLVFGWCQQHGIPVAFTLAGGYVGPDLTQDELVNLHLLTIRTAAVYSQ